MVGCAAVCTLGARPIVELFTREPRVVSLAIPLMWIAALFAVFDGIQVTVTGVLRGAGDTRTPMVANLVAHWLLGLPTGYFLCFVWGFGVLGLWTGLSIGLIVTALSLVWAWWRKPLSC